MSYGFHFINESETKTLEQHLESYRKEYVEFYSRINILKYIKNNFNLFKDSDVIIQFIYELSSNYIICMIIIKDLFKLNLAESKTIVEECVYQYKLQRGDSPESFGQGLED